MSTSKSEITSEHPVVALGGGPAGLTAGYLLSKAGKPVIVLESTDQVGGIARTEVRDGYRFDLGGHRFFTKAREVDDLWHEIMKEEFLRRPRRSRIYWRGRFLEYPLQGIDVIRKLGPVACGGQAGTRVARYQLDGAGGRPGPDRQGRVRRAAHLRSDGASVVLR
jgi:protoporphyrinogen oxidase